LESSPFSPLPYRDRPIPLSFGKKPERTTATLGNPKKVAPLLWPWESKPERTPHEERAAGHPYSLGGPKPDKPLAEGGF